MNKTDAYKVVLDDMKQCSLFCGKWDAKHGKDAFMHGVALVMEWIADRAGDETFIDEFDKNYVESKMEAADG